MIIPIFSLPDLILPHKFIEVALQFKIEKGYIINFIFAGFLEKGIIVGNKKVDDKTENAMVCMILIALKITGLEVGPNEPEFNVMIHCYSMVNN